jgi:hypothetical protein
MFKRIILPVITIFVVTSVFAEPKTKSAEDLFKKWQTDQHVYVDEKLKDEAAKLDDNFASNFKNSYEQNFFVLQRLAPYLKNLTNNQINESGYQLQPKLDEAFKQNLCKLYEMFDQDISGLVTHFQQNNFLPKYSGLADQEQADILIARNEAFISLFLSKTPMPDCSQQTLALANRIFEYCFGTQNFFDFQKLLLNRHQHAIIRFFYTVMWRNLSGDGWSTWLQENLTTLKQQALQGKQIVYLAGGNDIFQLLKNGVYNIKNIDPMLSTQTKYYISEWEWLVKSFDKDNGIGDKVTFDTGLTMERTEYTEDGVFKVRLENGKIVSLPKSKTTWKICGADGKQLGQYVHERRLVTRDDFTIDPTKILLMSFNELYFTTLPDFMNGWQIEPFKLDDNIQIIVKQLRKPVTKKVLCNMEIANIINAVDLNYLGLGTSIN